jgi:hypothetical protein
MRAASRSARWSTVIKAGRRVKPIIAPDEPVRLLAGLRSHNVTVPSPEQLPPSSLASAIVSLPGCG